MATHNSSEEISIYDLGRGIKKIYHAILVGLYRFFIKRWIVLLLLIIVGIALGFFSKKVIKPGKKTTLIVQLNYNSAHLIYNAVGQLERKIKDHDVSYLKQHHFYKDKHMLLTDISIAPVVDLDDILYKINLNENTTQLLTAQFSREGSLYSKVLIPQYTLQYITIKTTRRADLSLVKRVVNFLNSNKILQGLKTTYTQDLSTKLHEYSFSIAQIDSILKNLGTSIPTKNSTKISIQTDQGGLVGLPEILAHKANLLDKVTRLKAISLHYNEPVVLMNTPIYQNLKGRRLIQYPIILIVLYLLFTLVVSGCKKANQLIAAQESHS